MDVRVPGLAVHSMWSASGRSMERFAEHHNTRVVELMIHYTGRVYRRFSAWEDGLMCNDVSTLKTSASTSFLPFYRNYQRRRQNVYL